MQSKCLVCSALTLPRKRVVIHPPSATIVEVRSFYCEKFRPGFAFDSSIPAYECQTPCFPLLGRGGKCLREIEEILQTLREAAATSIQVAIYTEALGNRLLLKHAG